ncbi:MAG: 2-oxoacid:acceptor oxidoreductase family protein [Spirochaetaceae bacterium]
MSQEKIIAAGFGGQGIMSMGRLIAYTGMHKDKEVSWLPSYGPEMRGGTANCNVIVSDTPIGSPIISGDATTVIAMNYPSLVKFQGQVVAGGLLLYNSSFIENSPERENVRVIPVPANRLAQEAGSLKVANMVILGAFLAATKLFELDDVIGALKKVFGPSKEKFIPMNEEALKKGMQVAETVEV